MLHIQILLLNVSKVSEIQVVTQSSQIKLNLKTQKIILEILFIERLKLCHTQKKNTKRKNKKSEESPRNQEVGEKSHPSTQGYSLRDFKRPHQKLAFNFIHRVSTNAKT